MQRSDPTYIAEVRGSRGCEVPGGVRHATAEWRFAECDNDRGPEWEKEERSSQEGC